MLLQWTKQAFSFNKLILLFNALTLANSSPCNDATSLVYSLIIISFSISASNLILCEVLQPLLSLCMPQQLFGNTSVCRDDRSISALKRFMLKK